MMNCKRSNIQVTQKTGQSMNEVMSQKAVTDAINNIKESAIKDIEQDLKPIKSFSFHDKVIKPDENGNIFCSNVEGSDVLIGQSSLNGFSLYLNEDRVPMLGPDKKLPEKYLPEVSSSDSSGNQSYIIDLGNTQVSSTELDIPYIKDSEIIKKINNKEVDLYLKFRQGSSTYLTLKVHDAVIENSSSGGTIRSGLMLYSVGDSSGIAIYVVGLSFNNGSATTFRVNLKSTRLDNLSNSGNSGLTLGTTEGTAFDGAKGNALEEWYNKLKPISFKTPSTTARDSEKLYLSGHVYSMAGSTAAADKFITLPAATNEYAGIMTAEDKKKLDSLTSEGFYIIRGVNCTLTSGSSQAPYIKGIETEYRSKINNREIPLYMEISNIDHPIQVLNPVIGNTGMIESGIMMYADTSEDTVYVYMIKLHSQPSQNSDGGQYYTSINLVSRLNK